MLQPQLRHYPFLINIWKPIPSLRSIGKTVEKFFEGEFAAMVETLLGGDGSTVGDVTEKFIAVPKCQSHNSSGEPMEDAKLPVDVEGKVEQG